MGSFKGVRGPLPDEPAWKHFVRRLYWLLLLFLFVAYFIIGARYFYVSKQVENHLSSTATATKTAPVTWKGGPLPPDWEGPHAYIEPSLVEKMYRMEQPFWAAAIALWSFVAAGFLIQFAFGIKLWQRATKVSDSVRLSAFASVR